MFIGYLLETNLLLHTHQKNEIRYDRLLSVMMSVEELNEGLGIESIETEGEPPIPIIILTIIQLDLIKFILTKKLIPNIGI